MTALNRAHPFVSFIYFAVVITFAVTLSHPICLAVSLFCATASCIVFKGFTAAKKELFASAILFAVCAAANPLFNHAGVTVLCYFPDGNALTAESIIYGLSSACILASVILWFSAVNAVMTSDKIIYLSGRAIPSLSLVLSMALRFVPRFTRQFAKVAQAQKSIGRGLDKGSLLQRAKNGAAVLSVMITWSLENAVDTSVSLKSRGFGLGKRTAFSRYFFTIRDAGLLMVITMLCGYVTIGCVRKGMYFRYFPDVRSTPITPYSASLFAAYITLCLLPVLLEIVEEIRWNALKSKA